MIIPRNKAVVRTSLGMDDCAAGGIFKILCFNILVAVTRRVNFLEACSLSKEISTCDNSGETPRCFVEEKVGKVHLFTSSAAGNKCREELIA